ncbi:MAG: hypothetical protein FJ291_13675 [Planctomycetes bacterium]|nr:hypothetical protein [Planctomycetota bacterium]
MARIVLVPDASEAEGQLRKAIIRAGHQVAGLPSRFGGASSAEDSPPDLVVVERRARERGDARVRRAEADAALNAIPVAIFDSTPVLDGPSAAWVRLPKALQEMLGRFRIGVPAPGAAGHPHAAPLPRTLPRRARPRPLQSTAAMSYNPQVGASGPLAQLVRAGDS